MDASKTASLRIPESDGRPDSSGDGDVVILGAGPAGLTAAWELNRGGRDVTVFEADPEFVGGIARTASYKGFRFDIGGHRFFTKSDEVRKLWHEILAEEHWLTVPRLSRIYYRNKFFHYPLKASNALRNLGLFQTFLCLLSYAKAKMFPRKNEVSLEDWVVNRFGWRLYRIFFKTYTEKVWGIPCTEISADWAAQRIKGLSLTEAVKNALFGGRGKNKKGELIKTLIEEFEYPKMGPGMMWEHATEQLRASGTKVHMGTPVVGLRHGDGRLQEVEVETPEGRRAVRGEQFISTLPMRELVNMMEPTPPAEVIEAANQLSYRDFLTVALVVDRAELFPDNWIYIHDPTVKLGRVQNFRNWSPYMVPDPNQTALGLEYFCNEGDELWDAPDDELIALGKKEIAQLGLCREEEILDGTVVRMKKAYPVYDEHYRTHIATIRRYLETAAPNLQLVGRNGMHKYNNQDHSMMTALLAARNILGERWDPWKVNTDAEYHEEAVEDAEDTSGRQMPRTLQRG